MPKEKLSLFNSEEDRSTFLERFHLQNENVVTELGIAAFDPLTPSYDRVFKVLDKRKSLEILADVIVQRKEYKEKSKAFWLQSEERSAALAHASASIEEKNQTCRTKRD